MMQKSKDCDRLGIPKAGRTEGPGFAELSQQPDFAFRVSGCVAAAFCGNLLFSTSFEAKVGGGLAAFQKSSLPSANTSKALYLQCLESFRLPFSASLCGKCFSPHFPQTENGRGFDSRLHIKCGDIVTQVYHPKIFIAFLVLRLLTEHLHISTSFQKVGYSEPTGSSVKTYFFLSVIRSAAR
jgi:hypothetical protein